MRQFTCPKAVTHPSTDRARCRATALIETNALPLHQTANPTGLSGVEVGFQQDHSVAVADLLSEVCTRSSALLFCCAAADAKVDENDDE